MTFAALVAWQQFIRNGESEYWKSILLVVSAYAVSTVVGALVAGMILIRLPRRARKWVLGDQPPIAAATDDKTGYHALCFRLEANQIKQLPIVSFRYRRGGFGEVHFRIVNFDRAMALEKILPSPEPNTWYDATIDLCQMIRESDPDFFGDEFHLTGRPETGIEVDDINIRSVSHGE